MDLKITRNYSIYQKTVNSGKGADKNIPSPVPAEGKLRSDEICISSDGVKKQEAARMAAGIASTMREGASTERIAQLKQQVAAGTYQVPAELVARRLANGL
ncbi:flagellar biosynthesis anti-sigma factor FlgM [Diplocloster agilis]|uniref:flagellar biosynthesis anti-sigma factor FlgM n=1 Tax=Diplocloster agilis TaxID=2850323 RepID=UPI000822CC09|nr:flagellar biosynthesis anti-sigma factor FlgM [Suonthocola fibrivorans]MCU6734560.1 flagellar biosynthesis anti-sigma factor FlgM [Suonthocola fibrivorans]SCJ44566.1 flagellar biosynthesis anti-sigma factor FlgM [uncultured Clostridium sp.]